MRSNESLKAEYLLIQGQYEAFDQRALSMKALATPLLGAGIAFGAKEHNNSVLWATVLVAGSLWLLEAMWKGFQYSLSERIQRLEGWFRGEGEEEEAPFQVYSSWTASYRRRRIHHTALVMMMPFVCLPYVIVIVAALTLISQR